MKCKKCGYALPFSGFVCPNCKTIMNKEQIQRQKEEINQKNFFYKEMVSEKYGHKDFIYEKREHLKKKYNGILLLIGTLILLILLALFVYL